MKQKKTSVPPRENDPRYPDAPPEEWMYLQCPTCGSKNIDHFYGYKGKITEDCNECGAFLAWG